MTSPAAAAGSPIVRTRNTTMRASTPVSARLPSDENAIIARRYGSRQANRRPSRTPPAPAPSDRRSRGGSMALRQPNETTKLAAFASSPVTGPAACASSPPSPGPPIWAASRLPSSLAFPSVRSASSTTAGSSTW